MAEEVLRQRNNWEEGSEADAAAAADICHDRAQRDGDAVAVYRGAGDRVDADGLASRIQQRPAGVAAAQHGLVLDVLDAGGIAEAPGNDAGSRGKQVVLCR